MKLIVGLGNPGLKYKNTWHNLGWLVIDRLFSAYEADFDKPKISADFQAQITLGQIGEQKIILAKPQTFMNDSGLAVKKIMTFYRLTPADLWLVHDDIDLPLGKIKLSQNASSAGHKGVQSVIDELGLQEFGRFRVGILQPDQTLTTEKYVLQKIDQVDKIDNSLDQACQAIIVALQTSLAKAMSRFN